VTAFENKRLKKDNGFDKKAQSIFDEERDIDINAPLLCEHQKRNPSIKAQQ